ncbi:MAG TPA: sigma-70 family RNA polymerase sigma factor [Chitinophagaceae bacterium]|nr:sigma-70 family RNA polymerase sigma factor [Chitinophagaceae bacterium]
MHEYELYDEKTLLSLLKKGDKRAFAALYKLYSKPLYINMLRMVKSEIFADELLQDIFVAVWEKRNSLDIKKSFGAYILRVGKNKVFDFFRKAKRESKVLEEIKWIASQYYEESDGNDLTEYNADLLEKAIESLPPQRRHIFKLCKLQGRSYIEVSKELNISTSTINDHLVKAARSIKEFIATNSQLTFCGIVFLLFTSP